MKGAAFSDRETLISTIFFFGLKASSMFVRPTSDDELGNAEGGGKFSVVKLIGIELKNRRKNVRLSVFSASFCLLTDWVETATGAEFSDSEFDWSKSICSFHRHAKLKTRKKFMT